MRFLKYQNLAVPTKFRLQHNTVLYIWKGIVKVVDYFDGEVTWHSGGLYIIVSQGFLNILIVFLEILDGSVHWYAEDLMGDASGVFFSDYWGE